MRINNLDKVYSLYKQNDKLKAGLKEKNPLTDEFNISNKAMDFQLALNKLRDQDQARTSRVEDIKKLYQAGDYKIDSGKIADKLVDTALLHKRI